MFEVVNYSFPYFKKDCIFSKHSHYERTNRNDYIKKHFDLTNKKLVNVFVVNKGHEHGIELHAIYESGVIEIVNPLNRRIVTYLIARPNQIKRYYQIAHVRLKNKTVIDNAIKNQVNHLNEI